MIELTCTHCPTPAKYIYKGNSLCGKHFKARDGFSTTVEYIQDRQQQYNQSVHKGVWKQ